MSNAHSQDIYLLDHLVSHLTSPLFLGDETQLLKMCNEAGFYPTTQQYCVLIVRIERWSTVLSRQNGRRSFAITFSCSPICSRSC